MCSRRCNEYGILMGTLPVRRTETQPAWPLTFPARSSVRSLPYGLFALFACWPCTQNVLRPFIEQSAAFCSSESSAACCILCGSAAKPPHPASNCNLPLSDHLTNLGKAYEKFCFFLNFFRLLLCTCFKLYGGCNATCMPFCVRFQCAVQKCTCL